MRTVFALTFSVLAAACSDGGSASPAPNTPPIAIASAPSSAAEGESVTLSGASSSDADGAIVGFSWRQIAGPSVRLSGATTDTARFQAPLVSGPTVFSFELAVTDDQGGASTSAVDITVDWAAVMSVAEIETVFDGRARAYSVYTPASYVPGAQAVVLLHGGGQSMRRVVEPQRTAGRWLDLAEQNGFLLIAPNGFNQTLGDGLGDQQSWNDLRNDLSGRTSLEDDVGFILETLDVVEAARGFDASRVFVTGSSNGGMMTMRLVVEEPDRFSGAAAFIGALPEEPISDPLSPTPIMLLNGTEDQLILFGGGPVDQDGAPTRSAPATVDFFVRVTGADASSAVTTELPDVDPADGCVIIETRYPFQGSEAPAVIFYEARGGGHNIPDPDAAAFSPAAESLVGPRCRDVNGVDLAFAFLMSL